LKPTMDILNWILLFLCISAMQSSSVERIAALGKTLNPINKKNFWTYVKNGEYEKLKNRIESLGVSSVFTEDTFIHKVLYILEEAIHHNELKENKKEIAKMFINEFGKNDNTYFINAINHFGTTPFLLACWVGDEDIVKLLVNHGADLYARDNRGEMCIHYAVNSRNNPKKITQWALDTFGDAIINEQTTKTHLTRSGTEYGYTPIMVMINNNATPEMVQFLLDKGAKLHLKTSVGSNVFHIASRDVHPKLPTFKVLLDCAKSDIKQLQDLLNIKNDSDRNVIDVINNVYENVYPHFQKEVSKKIYPDNIRNKHLEKKMMVEEVINLNKSLKSTKALK